MSIHPKTKHTILILGASGFIGNTLYRELLSYFRTFGTYCTQRGVYEDNQVFFKFCAEEDSIAEILERVQPSLIISSLLGSYSALLKTHQDIASYIANNHHSRILYISSADVFDGLQEFPSYENDTPKAESAYGRHKLAVEKLLLEQIPAQTTILRVPMVLGVTSPRVTQLRQASKHKATFEVHPNQIISITTADKLAQQVHYIINQELDGIFHLASEDVIHHEDLFRELCDKFGDDPPIFKSVFQRNDDSFLAILPKLNKLPKSYRITVSEVVDACTLKEEISTFKK